MFTLKSVDIICKKTKKIIKLFLKYSYGIGKYFVVITEVVSVSPALCWFVAEYVIIIPGYMTGMCRGRSKQLVCVGCFLDYEITCLTQMIFCSFLSVSLNGGKMLICSVSLFFDMHFTIRVYPNALVSCTRSHSIGLFFGVEYHYLTLIP